MDILAQTDNIISLNQSQLALNRAKSQLANINNSGNEKSTLDDKTLNRIDKAAKEYEAVFISQMLSHTMKDVGKDALFHGGQTEDAFQEFLVQEYGKIIAGQGGIGLADQVKSELIKIQENAQ